MDIYLLILAITCSIIFKMVTCNYESEKLRTDYVTRIFGRWVGYNGEVRTVYRLTTAVFVCYRLRRTKPWSAWSIVL